MRGTVGAEPAPCQVSHRACPACRKGRPLTLRNMCEPGGTANGSRVLIRAVVDIGGATPIKIVRAEPYMAGLVLFFLAIFFAVPVTQAVFLTFVLLPVQR